MGRTFETIEKLLKSVKSTTTATTLAINNLSMTGTLDVSGAVSLGDDVAVSGELTAPILTTPEVAASGAATAPGLGAVGTAAAPVADILVLADQIITTINIDLTGLKSVSDVDDVIGIETDAPPAYLTNISDDHNGVIFKTEMICTELPTAASNVLLDIDLASNAAADGAYSTDGAAYTKLINASGNWSVGLIKTSTAGTNPAAGDYLYLCDGATHTAASVFTGGQFVIKLYGYKTR